MKEYQKPSRKEKEKKKWVGNHGQCLEKTVNSHVSMYWDFYS